ncbi:MAG: DMT family transporter [Pseudomonadota bacterium]
MDSEQIGKLIRVGAAAATVGVASCVHAAAKELPIGQIMFFRALVAGLLIAIWARATAPGRDLLPRRWRPHLIRGALSCGAMTLTFVSMARLPITQAQTLTFLAPLIVVPLAMARLNEALTVRLLVGLGLGFAGVVMILGLSAEAGPAALWGALAGVAGAVLIAMIQVNVRAMTATETTRSIALSFTFIVAAATLPTAALGGWVWPAGTALYAMLGAGVFGALNVVMFTMSLARAPASVIAPLDYTGLLWAVMVDWLLFAQIPGPWGILGSVLITLAALLVVLSPRSTAPRTPTT